MPDTRTAFLIDHIGWDLARAYRGWNSQFRSRMAEAGHGWFAEARGNLLKHIGPYGASQTALATLSGLSKQAVQQHLGDLERDGVIVRHADPLDARKNHVSLSKIGHEAMRSAERIKRDIEIEMSQYLGAGELDRLKHLLGLIARSSNR
jgi:DNA-binding MarR family transcriptional regulator